MAYAPEQDDASVIAAPASADPYIAAAPPAQATARPLAAVAASERGKSVKSKGKKDKEKEKEEVKKDKEQKQEPGRGIGTDKHHLIINTKMSGSGTSGSPDHLRPNSAQQYHHPHHQHHQHQHHQRSTSGHGTPTSATMPHTPYSSTHPLSLDIDPSIAGAGAGQGYGPSGPITTVSGNGNGAGESSYSAPASASASASASGQPSASYYGSAAPPHPHTHTQMHPPPDDGRISPAAGAAGGGGPGSASASADGRPTSENFTQDGNPIVPVGISGGKMFQCRGYGACDKVFTRSEHLARHVRKHTGERPFPCHCGKAFSRLDNLRQHAATVHADATVLNEAMLQSLTPVHSALSNRASREQRRRGEIVEVPKNAVERPRHNDHRKDGPGSLTGQAAMGMGGGGGPPDIVVGAYPPYGDAHVHTHQQHQGHGGWEGQQSSVPPPDEGEGQPDGLGRHGHGHGHGHGMPPPQAMHHTYDYPYSSHQQHPHSLHAHLSDDGRRQASPATPSYGYTHHQPQHQQGHGQYFPDRPTPDGHLQQQQQQHFYRPLSASGYHGGPGGPAQVSDESGQRQGQGSQPPPSPLYPPGTHQHAQHNQHQHAQWSTPPPPSAYPHDQHPAHHQPSQSQSQSHLYAPQGHNGNDTSPAPEMGYPQQPHSPLPPHMQSHHAQHGYGQPQQPPTPGSAPASLGPESSHSQAPPGAGQGQNAGQGQGYGYPPAGGYYGPSHPYGHAQAHTPTGPGPYGSQQQHYFGGASNPPHSPLPFAYGQPGMQHTPVATPLHLPSHALPPQGHEYQQPQQQLQQQQGVQDFAYPQAGDGPGSDRKRRADGPDEYGGRSKMPRLSSETRHDSDQGRGGDKGFLGVPQHQHHHQQGYHSGSVSPLPGHMSIPPSTSSSMHEQSNGVGAGDSGNTSHVHANGNAGHSNHNNGVNNGHSNAHSIPTNHASSTNIHNNNNNGWPNNDNDDGELWFPPVTERRSSLAISALLGSPQPETKRLPNSMAMSAMTANAAQVASQAANGAGGVKTEGA